MSRVAASMPRAVRALVTGSWRSGGPAAQLPCGHGGRVHVSEGRLGSARLLGQRLQRQCSSSSSGGGQPDPETVSYLRDPVQNREVFLLGTAHVSEKSAEDVRRLIALVQPDHVFVELCDARASQLRMQRDSCSAARVEDSSFVQSLMSMQRHGSSAGFEAGAFLDNVIKAGLSSFYNIFRQVCTCLPPGVEQQHPLPPVPFSSPRRWVYVCACVRVWMVWDARPMKPFAAAAHVPVPFSFPRRWGCMRTLVNVWMGCARHETFCCRRPRATAILIPAPVRVHARVCACVDGVRAP